jgi:hypothetical protein
LNEFNTQNKDNTLANKEFNNAVDIVFSGSFEGFEALKKEAINPATIAMDAPLSNIIQQSKKNYIPLGNTPNILNVVGIDDLPMGMNYSKLFEIKDKHDLTPKLLKEVNQQLNNPTMIFKNSAMKAPPNSYVVVSEFIDKNKKSMVIALHVNKRQGAKGGLEINRIASIYGRKKSLIENALKNNDFF